MAEANRAGSVGPGGGAQPPAGPRGVHGNGAAGPRAVLPRSTGPRHGQERCEVCSTPIGEDHRHLADTVRRVLACACPACALLFDGEGAGHGRFRTVPDRFLYEPGPDGCRVDWEVLGFPVGFGFLLRASTLGRIVALHPGPAGAVERAIDPGVWQRALGDSELARVLADDVEALLLRRRDGRTDCHLVPVDAAYDVAARLRPHWRGFDGGPRARRELDAFYGLLADKAVPVRHPAGSALGPASRARGDTAG